MAEQFAVPLADTDPLEGHQGLAEQAPELGQHVGDPAPRAHGDDHHRRSRVTAEEGGPLTSAVRGPVHAQQRGGACDAPPVQQVADSHEGGNAVHAFLAAEVDGQLDLVARCLARRDRLDVAGQQPRPLQRDQSAAQQARGRSRAAPRSAVWCPPRPRSAAGHPTRSATGRCAAAAWRRTPPPRAAGCSSRSRAARTGRAARRRRSRCRRSAGARRSSS